MFDKNLQAPLLEARIVFPYSPFGDYRVQSWFKVYTWTKKLEDLKNYGKFYN